MSWAQPFSPQGGEYSLGALPGDQAFPSVSVTTNGGYMVWEDSAMDGNGLGIGAQQLDSSFSPRFGAFRVNQRTAGNQQKPRVATLNRGGAAIVWQGGGQRFANIYARFLNAGGTFTSTNDIRVNSTTNSDQLTPALTVMTNGNVFVVWSSWNYSVTNMLMQDIRAQILTTNGTLVGTNFYINSTNAKAPTELYNQRSPAATTLANGNIVVVWVSENQGVPGVDFQRGTNWVHIYGKLYNPSGAPLGSEFRVNTPLHGACANPAVCGTSDGGFTVVWSYRRLSRTITNVVVGSESRWVGVEPDGWDVYGRNFAANGVVIGDDFRVNSYTYGDQFGPKISRAGSSQLVVWTSLGQDGSWEGVYGQLLSGGTLFGSEFRVNTTTISRQIHPVTGSDGVGRFLVAWSSFVGDSSFDLLVQRYAAGQPLPHPSAPFVAPLSPYAMGVTWPAVSGFPLSYYEVYQDGNAVPAVTTPTNRCIINGLAPGSTHWFQTAFVIAGGQRSPLSPPTTNKTWGVDMNGKFGIPDGLPDDWQMLYFGTKTVDWDAPNVDSDGDGASNWQEFLAGTNPRDPNSVLKTWMSNTPQGRRMSWSTVAGCVYQIEATTDFQNWNSIGLPRLAAGSSDSMLLIGGDVESYYRVIRVQ